MRTVNQILADNRRMERFIGERIPPDHPTRIVLADCWNGPVWADLFSTWDDEGECDLFVETNEPDGFGLRDVYEHFRRKEMTGWELEREWVISIGQLAKIPKNMAENVPKPNTSGTLTVSEAADELHCSISFVYKLMYVGDLIYEKRGRRKLPTVTSIAEYRQRNLVVASQRFDYPKRNSHEPYQYQQLFKKVKRKKRGT